jgi:L-ascorbate metabolism protein UlaG (beta-lactamase superfamily)
VPAYNISPEKRQFHPKGRDNGFVLTIEGMRIYIAGDTEDYPEMDTIKDIDVAFLPCNLPYTMSPEQCSHAATMIKPTVLFPYHYGQTDIQQVVKLLDGSGIDVRIRNYQ